MPEQDKSERNTMLELFRDGGGNILQNNYFSNKSDPYSERFKTIADKGLKTEAITPDLQSTRHDIHS